MDDSAILSGPASWLLRGMQIAHLIPPGIHAYSGLLTALIHLAVAQARQGHVVEVWYLNSWMEDGAEFERKLDETGIQRIELPSSRSWLKLNHATIQAAHRRAVDIVHLHGVFNPFNNQIARCLQVPYAISPHGGYAPESLAFHSARKQVFRWLFELPMLRRARLVCALSEREADDIRRFGITSPLAVIPNGVDEPLQGSDGAAFRAVIGLRPDDRLAMYVGRVDVRAKRLDALVRGIAHAPEWHLALIGGDFRDGIREIQRLAQELRLVDRVHIVGPRRGRMLEEAISAADVCVLLSRSEGMPMALLEAAALGIPAIVSPEVEQAIGWVEAGAGWVSEPSQFGTQLSALTHVPASEWERRRSAALELARAHSWSGIANQYDQAYVRAISQGQGRRGGSEPVQV